MARKTLCEVSEPFNLKDEQKDMLSGEQKENKRIDPITIDYTAGGASVLNIMGVFAVLFAIIALLCYLLYPQQDNSESVTETKEVILRTPFENEGYTTPNSKNDVMSVMSRGNGEPLTPKDNEITDGRVAFALPNGVRSEKIFPVEGDADYYGYDILDNEQHPNYSIRVLSKYMTGAFGYNEFEDLLKKYDKERSLEKIVRTRADNSRYLDNNTFCYEANRVYETDPKMATDIAVIRSYSRHVLCYIICERTEDVESPFDDIVKTIRFE